MFIMESRVCLVQQGKFYNDCWIRKMIRTCSTYSAEVLQMQYNYLKHCSKCRLRNLSASDLQEVQKLPNFCSNFFPLYTYWVPNSWNLVSYERRPAWFCAYTECRHFSGKFHLTCSAMNFTEDFVRSFDPGFQELDDLVYVFSSIVTTKSVFFEGQRKRFPRR